MAAETVYAEEMYCIGRGYALWQGDPLDDYAQINVGDTGYIQDGKFHPGWNKWTSNGEQLPQLHHTSLDVRHPFLSKTVKQHALAFGFDNDQMPGIIPTSIMPGAGAGVSYNCSSSRGAILTLVDRRATTYDLGPIPEKKFLEYILHNMEEVIANSNCASINDLVAITGCTMTGDWEAAVITSTSQGGHIDATGGAPAVIMLKAEVSIQKTHEQSIQMSGGHHHNPHVNSIDCCDRPKNQCIFIRSYRFKRRLWRYRPVKQMKAAASPKDGKRREDDYGHGHGSSLSITSSGALCGSESDDGTSIQAERFPPTPQYDTASEEMFEWIFKTQENAELAVIHDRDIMRWKDDYFSQEPQTSWRIQTTESAGQTVAYLRSPQSKALIISLRYIGQDIDGADFEIPRDHQDADRLRDILIKRYHYRQEDITVIKEGECDVQLTTGAGLKNAMAELVRDPQDNDRYVFFFSGHASQVYTAGGGGPRDGYIETIWPTDHKDGLIYEHDIHDIIVEPLKQKACKLTALMDTCSSETVLDLTGTVDFSSDIEIIDEQDGPLLTREFSNFGLGGDNLRGEGPSSKPDTGSGFNWPEGATAKFQVIRGKLGLRENYICTSFAQYLAPVEVEGEDEPMEDPSMRHPAVVHFSRRTAIKASLLAAAGGDPDTARKMEPYHADYSRLPAREAIDAMTRSLAIIRDTLPQISQQDPDWFTFDCLERAFQAGLEVPMSQATQKLIDLSKCATMVSDLLCENVYLLQANNWDTHSTTMHGLLVFIMDLERFYKECREILMDIDNFEQDEKIERFVAITTRATEYKQNLLNLRNDLIPLEQDGNEDGPQSLLEEDTDNAPFFITSDNIPRATIVSWSNAVPASMYNVVRNTPGITMVKALLDLLDEHPHPRYWDVLNDLPPSLQNVESEDRKFAVMSDRVQLSSISALDMGEPLTL